MNGKLVEWSNANVHFLTHSLHYGNAIFEGIRAYKTKKGTAVFRLREHIERFFYSASIIEMELPYKKKELCEAITSLVNKNNLSECYIRPLAYWGYGKMGLHTMGLGVDVGIGAWGCEPYLGKKGINEGISVKVSEMLRPSMEFMPTKAKVSGNYANSIMAKNNALKEGYNEALLLDRKGFVAELSVQNFFLIKDNVLKTPTTENCLDGITRRSVIELAAEMGLNTEVKNIPLEEVFSADEVFSTGTMAEITPITSINKRRIGTGFAGRITKSIQEEYRKVTHGENKNHEEWLSYVK